MASASKIEVTGSTEGRFAEILTPEALEFIAELHRRFNPRRLELLAARAERQKRFDAGEKPDFLPETRTIREDDTWRVAPVPADLQDRPDPPTVVPPGAQDDRFPDFEGTAEPGSEVVVTLDDGTVSRLAESPKRCSSRQCPR